MAGLMRLLDLGAGAIAAHSVGVAVAGRNTANVNSPGYSRERVELAAERAAPLVGGVRAGGLSRAEDGLLSGRERVAAGAAGHAQALASALASLEPGLHPPGGDILHSIANLFGEVADLAAAPLDEPRRRATLAAAGDVAGSFRGAARALTEARADANLRLTDRAGEATLLASRVAAANRALATESDPVLADQRDLDAAKLADLMGGRTRLDSDGMMRIVVGAGTVLVDGERAAAVRTVPDPNRPGDLRVEVVDGVHRNDVTTALDGGRIAGEIAFRDGALQTAQSDLDALAGDVIARFNAVHTQNAGLDGVAGRNLFVPAAGPGTAASFAVDPTVDADPRLLAAANAGAGPGDNRGALALIALRDAPLAGNQTRSFLDEGIRLLGDVGVAASRADASRSLEAARADSLRAARVALSGVSMEEELQQLASFQHAAEAAHRFVATVNSLLADLIEKV